MTSKAQQRQTVPHTIHMKPTSQQVAAFKTTSILCGAAEGSFTTNVIESVTCAACTRRHNMLTSLLRDPPPPPKKDEPLKAVFVAPAPAKAATPAGTRVVVRKAKRAAPDKAAVAQRLAAITKAVVRIMRHQPQRAGTLAGLCAIVRKDAPELTPDKQRTYSDVYRVLTALEKDGKVSVAQGQGIHGPAKVFTLK